MDNEIYFNIMLEFLSFFHSNSSKRCPTVLKTSATITLNSSKFTIMQEGDNMSSNLLTATPSQNHNTDGLAIKLNCLKEKSARYNSHRDFLPACIQENFVPKGLEITLEPTIENFDQDPADNGYTILK